VTQAPLKLKWELKRVFKTTHPLSLLFSLGVAASALAQVEKELRFFSPLTLNLSHPTFDLYSRQIDELTQYINKMEIRINEVMDENEELRYKLGMDPRAPLDLTDFRKNKQIRKEEEKALNFILQRQVCISLEQFFIKKAFSPLGL
jgi:hypothetical protein